MTTTDLMNMLVKQDLTFLTGVPCSYLKDFLACLNSPSSQFRHILASSEGEAVGIAAGYHLATNKVPIVYLQNSGLGNAVNPLTSLMDTEVYSIPCILFLSWRGEPGTVDEPQHKKMGHIMLDLLRDMGIPYEFADNDASVTAELVQKLKSVAVNEQKPVALIFRSNIFEKTKKVSSPSNVNLMTREEILADLLLKIGKAPIISTTGKTSREIFELREQQNQAHPGDFMVVGSMGCAASIGLGVASQIDTPVFVIDGDGAVLMKMGTLATIGHYKPKNYIHILIDNGAYESTGGQPTVSATVNWKEIFKGVGYKEVLEVRSRDELESISFENTEGPCCVVIYSRIGSRDNLGRPHGTPAQNKRAFMSFVSR